ncbi:glycosyltransferase [Aquimarina sp. 2-A2]|uniref:glycosyltransferase n=1 Tax=Aquimarina sp. 2-A2 TaxID=3382644 RepID=UPI00387F039F
MKRIKIIHVLQSVGGVDVYLRLITENLDSEIFENIIIHQKDDSKKKYFNNVGQEIKQYYVPVQREINLFKDFQALYKTVSILKKEKPDIIHAHSAKGGILGRAASVFYKVNVLHTPHAYSYLSAQSKIKRTLFLNIERFFKKFNSYLLATSESEKSRGINDVGYNINKALKFNNSILPLNNFEAKPHVSLPQNYICTVGRPSYQKNIEMMVNVIYEVKKTIPNIYLVIMGVGEYSPNKDSVIKQISKLNLDNNILLIDWVEREKIISIIKQSLLYVSTSRYEGLPYSIIESLSLSKSCIVTDCDGNRDLVKDNYNGFIIRNESVNDMATKIIELYSDENKRSKFAANSYELFLKNFNLVSNIKELEKIYQTYS